MVLAPAAVCALTGEAAGARIENVLGTPPQVAETISHLAFMAKFGFVAGGIAGGSIGLTRLFRQG